MTVAPRVLLVEDDPGDVRLAMVVLRKLQVEHHAVVVSDGEEAMDYLLARGKFAGREPGLPAFILLDLKLPRVNGFELLQQIKSNESLKLIPVVALTSSRQERDVELAYAMGVNGYVVKSIDFASYSATFRAVALYWLAANQSAPNLTEYRSLQVQRESLALTFAQAFVQLGSRLRFLAWRLARQTAMQCGTQPLLERRAY